MNRHLQYHHVSPVVDNQYNKPSRIYLVLTGVIYTLDNVHFTINRPRWITDAPKRLQVLRSQSYIHVLSKKLTGQAPQATGMWTYYPGGLGPYYNNSPAKGGVQHRE